MSKPEYIRKEYMVQNINDWLKSRTLCKRKRLQFYPASITKKVWNKNAESLLRKRIKEENKIYH